MTRELLTLGIAEKQAGTDNYSVLAMDCDTDDILVLDLSGDQIISKQGDYIWDIGHITAVDSLLLNEDRNHNKYYTVQGKMIPIGKEKRLKQRLEDIKTSFRKFKYNTSKTTCLIKVKQVLEINTDLRHDGYRRHLLGVETAEGVQENLLDKDFRWVKYWNYVSERKADKSIESDRNRYRALLNRNGKDLYLVLYRRYYARRPGGVYWIVGMHHL